MLTTADQGNKLSVRVLYTDGGGTSERITSAETATISAAAPVSQVIYIHTDLLGSPVVQSNSQGEIQ